MFGISSVGRKNVCQTLIRLKQISSFNMSSSAMLQPLENYAFTSLVVTSPKMHVYHVELNRPDKMNAFNKDIWREIKECFVQLGEDTDCRSVVLSGRGKIFTAGIDLALLAELGTIVFNDEDVARKSRNLRKKISSYQETISSLEKCPKPVIAAIHSACIGAGVDLICAADIRHCSMDAWFQIKEVDAGLAADVGTLQRLPKIIGSESVVRELCFSAREFYSSEAERIGFISRVFPDKETLVENALELAKMIAEKSPVAVQTTKEALVHARDHTVHEGLEYIADRNMSSLQSEDLKNSALAMMKKQTPTFAKY